MKKNSDGKIDFNELTRDPYWYEIWDWRWQEFLRLSKFSVEWFFKRPICTCGNKIDRKAWIYFGICDKCIDQEYKAMEKEMEYYK